MKNYEVLVTDKVANVDRWYAGYHVFTKKIKVECEENAFDIGDRIAPKTYVVDFREV